MQAAAVDGRVAREFMQPLPDGVPQVRPTPVFQIVVSYFLRHTWGPQRNIACRLRGAAQVMQQKAKWQCDVS